MNLNDIKEKLNFKDKFDRMKRRLKKNAFVSFFYDMMAEDIRFEDLPIEAMNSSYFKSDFWNRRIDDLHERSKRMSLCCTYMEGDYYRFQGVKDLRKVNCCHDRFCDNCQNALSVQRSDKYLPVLLKLADDYDLYHVVLTVPNCTLSGLSATLDKMYYAYKRLCIFLSGRKNVRSVDYSAFGYLGSIRALEITKNNESNTFHPHFHCIFVCKKGSKLDTKRYHINPYSFKGNNSHIKRKHKVLFDGHEIEAPDRLFSALEILLQKTWYLLYNHIELNRSNIDELSLGYSCLIDNAKGRYKEVFKYATKGLLSSDPNADPKDKYEDFVLLFFTLFRRRLIQGYGCMYRMEFDNKIDMSPDELYLEVRKALHAIETPIAFYSTFEETEREIESTSGITYISRKSIAQLGCKDE